MPITDNNPWLLAVKSTAECTDLLCRVDHSSDYCTNDDNSCSRYNIHALTDTVILQCRTLHFHVTDLITNIWWAFYLASTHQMAPPEHRAHIRLNRPATHLSTSEG